MTRLIVVCEGQTEAEFCNSVLAPFLRNASVYLSAVLIKHSGGGGVRWSKLGKQLKAHLKSDSGTYVTTLVDYYGRDVPNDWPAAQAASAESNIHEKVAILENGMSNEVDERHTGRFIPYLQLHEFEALLYSSPSVIAPLLDGDTAEVEAALIEVIRSCSEPELINSRRDKTPARRLAALSPGYTKALLGPLLAEEIGLERIRAACPRFDRWVGRLEGLR